MPDDHAQMSDPWLTLAEIAAELRVNPATVRLWVSRGDLKATRAGQRKWLVRRSELDRMLGEERAAAVGPEPTGAVEPTPVAPPRRLPAISQSSPRSAFASDRVQAGEIGIALEALQRADVSWSAALDATANPPPAPGFTDRVRALAEASDQEAAALRVAAVTAGMSWNPTPDSREMTLSYELRPGANRPGSPELWQQFDAAVEQLGLAWEGSEMSIVAGAFMALAAVMYEIADELEHDDRRPAQRLAG